MVCDRGRIESASRRGVGILRDVLPFAIRLLRRGPRVHQVFAVPAPESAGLYEGVIVGSGQRLQLSGGLTVPGQNALGGEEYLAETIVAVKAVVEPAVEIANVRAGVLDGRDHVLAVR